MNGCNREHNIKEVLKVCKNSSQIYIKLMCFFFPPLLWTMCRQHLESCQQALTDKNEPLSQGSQCLSTSTFILNGLLKTYHLANTTDTEHSKWGEFKLYLALPFTILLELVCSTHVQAWIYQDMKLVAKIQNEHFSKSSGKTEDIHWRYSKDCTWYFSLWVSRFQHGKSATK